jgi:hypothetical protein
MSDTLFPSHSLSGSIVNPNLTVSPTYTVDATTWQNSSISNSTADTLINAGGQIELRGDKADVVINGVSLSATLKGIQDRLNMLQPNAALEAEWDELQELGKQYRKLEAELLEKQRAWNILRKTSG